MQKEQKVTNKKLKDVRLGNTEVKGEKASTKQKVRLASEKKNKKNGQGSEKQIKKEIKKNPEMSMLLIKYFLVMNRKN